MKKHRLGYYSEDFKDGMTLAAEIASLMACSTDDQHRHECQLWVAREIEEFRDFKPKKIKKQKGI